MANTMDASRVYETLLSTPGMSEMVKIDLKVSRKTLLLLNRAVEKGLEKDDSKGLVDLLNSASQDSINELENLVSDCLQKAGLTELNEKINTLTAS